MLLLIEFVLSALIVPLALIAPRLGSGFFSAIEKKVSRLAARRGLAVFAVFILALAARLAVLPVEPIPHPGVHDEFSYLLMADTFAHGRLTNPPHPMWQHFETFHVLQLPTYCSIYYPAQGLLLALGERLAGHPFWGVWLSTGLMCAAFCWALQGWMSPGWAFLGGILAIIRLGTFSYWADSYWGGSVAALGGALVLGALPRVRRYQRIQHAALFAGGLAILGNSRPYEGVFYSTPIFILLAWSVLRSNISARRIYWNRFLFQSAMALLLTIAAMCYYFKQCTGSIFISPYVVDLRTYEVAPLFPWQSVRHKITYRYPAMAAYSLGSVKQYEDVRQHPIVHILLRALEGGLFFIGPLLLVPWFVLGVILPYGMSPQQLGPKTGQLVAILVFSAIGIALPVFFHSHYAAPVCCTLYALEIQALRRIYIHRKHERATGKAIVRLFVIGCFFMLGLRASANRLHVPMTPAWLTDWEAGGRRELGREPILEDLIREPGTHLVIVKYSANHDPHSEWVYNEANIDQSKIVWAQDMGVEQNAELIRYFSGRRVWLAEPDKTPPQVTPYAVATMF